MENRICSLQIVNVSKYNFGLHQLLGDGGLAAVDR